MNDPSSKYSLSDEDMDAACQGAGLHLFELRGQHIFLAGCTAFMGKWLLDCLLWANARYDLGVRLTILARDSARFLRQMPHMATRPEVHIIQGDITSFPDDALENFDSAIHAVNLPNDTALNWAARHCTTAVAGTERLYRLAAERGCKAIMLTSSGAVYGTRCLGGESPFHEEPYEEKSALAEATVYSETKRFLEVYASALGQAHGIRTVIARCFAFSGAHIPINNCNALGMFMVDALAGRDIIIKGDGSPMRSFLYGSDMVAWLFALLVAGKHGTPYNVGSAHGVKLVDLAHTLLRCANSNAKVIIQGHKLQGNAPSIYVPNTERICAELRVAERISLETGLERTLQWLKPQTQKQAESC